MSTLGDTLRGERLRRGLKPEEIAAELKIAPYMVEAMETGRFDRRLHGLQRGLGPFELLSASLGVPSRIHRRRPPRVIHRRSRGAA